MKKGKETLALVLAAGMLAASVSGCGSASSGTSATTAAGTAAADTAASDAGTTAASDDEGLDLVVQFATEVATLDSTIAASSDTMGMMRAAYEGLVHYGEGGKLVPGLATDSSVSDDGLTYTFTIREANWSNGTPITANDFVYAWKRLADPATGSQYASMLVAAGVKNAEAVTAGEADKDTLGVSAPDDRTFVVELENPVPYFPSLMNQPYFYPLNEEFVEAQGDQYGLSKDNVISSGPFVISEWEPGSGTIVLSKNENYYGADDIHVNTLTFETIKDTQQAIMAWESGTIDNIVLNGDFVAQYNSDPAYYSEVESRVNYIIPNTKVPGLDNANLRHALALSFDKNAIANDILKDGSIAADFICPEKFAVNDAGVSFREAANNAVYLQTDKALAKEYFDKAVAELGTDTFTFELLYGDSEANKNVAQFIQSEIQSTLPGVTITLKSQADKARNELMVQKDFELGLYRWGADYEDGTTYLDMYTTTHDHNFGGWSNAEYDALMERAHNEDATDLDARVQDMVKAEAILLDDAALFPVFQSAKTYLTNPELDVPYAIKGFQWQFAKKRQ